MRRPVRTILAFFFVFPLTFPSCRRSDTVERQVDTAGRGTETPVSFSADDLLDRLSERAFRWFLDNVHPVSGLVRDRSPHPTGSSRAYRVSEGEDARRSNMASIASCGYFLSALPDAARIGHLGREEAIEHCRRQLRFVLGRLDHHHGLLYHFVHWETGERWDECEVSLLDSAIFFNGCVVAARAFRGDIEELTDRLLERVRWDRFVVTDVRSGKPLLSLGWKPETGLLGPADVRSSEMAMAYFLAVGARTAAIAPQLWYNTRVVRGTLQGERILNPEHPLFTSYYGLGWHDLEGRVDLDGVDLFENARRAALANRAFCRSLAARFPVYGEARGGWWGISAGDSPRGYVARGPRIQEADGMVWPVAALAALPWIPAVLSADLQTWSRSDPWSRVSGRYGLSPFNLSADWIGTDVVGIDLGSFYLSLANYRRRTIWDLWKEHPIARNALRRLGYEEE